MTYKGYTESGKNATLKYMAEKQKRVPLNWLKEDFEKRIVPAVNKTGYSMNAFIKEAVVEKLQRMGKLDNEGNLVD